MTTTAKSSTTRHLLGLGSFSKVRAVEFMHDKRTGEAYWRIWLAADDKFENGMALECFDDGSVFRVKGELAGPDEVVLVMPKRVEK